MLAILVRILGDLDLAEDAVQEAFAIAVERWQRDGDPSNPGALDRHDGPQPGHRPAAAGARAAREDRAARTPDELATARRRTRWAPRSSMSGSA